MPNDFVIVGSGISASIASAFLREKKRNYYVIEKYDEIGGRFSTVEINDKFYNHANLFIRDSHDDLVEIINYFCPNLLKKIFLDYMNLIENQSHRDSRFIYLPSDRKMQSVCTSLLGNSPLLRNFELKKIKKENNYFLLSSDKKQIKAKHVILTTPPTTTRDILAQFDVLLNIPETNFIYTLLAEYKGVGPDFYYYKFINHDILKEILIDKEQNNLVIHANDFLHRNIVALDENFIKEAILDSFKIYFDMDINLVDYKFWKYGKVIVRESFKNHFQFDDNHLFIFSDWVTTKRNSNAIAQSFHGFSNNYHTVF